MNITKKGINYYPSVKAGSPYYEPLDFVEYFGVHGGLENHQTGEFFRAHGDGSFSSDSSRLWTLSVPTDYDADGTPCEFETIGFIEDFYVCPENDDDDEEPEPDFICHTCGAGVSENDVCAYVDGGGANFLAFCCEECARVYWNHLTQKEKKGLVKLNPGSIFEKFFAEEF